MVRVFIDGRPTQYRVDSTKLVGYNNIGERIELVDKKADFVTWCNLSKVELFDEFGDTVIINDPADKITSLKLF